jgi:hypothetical protein
VELEGSSSCSQESATGPYPEPDEFNPHLPPYFLNIHFNVILPLALSGLFPSSFPFLWVILHAFGMQTVERRLIGWLIKDKLEGSELLTRHSSGATEETHKKIHVGVLVSRPRFEPSTSWILKALPHANLLSFLPAFYMPFSSFQCVLRIPPIWSSWIWSYQYYWRD